MNPRVTSLPHSSRRGSALITVLGFSFILLLLIASVMKYAGSERKMNNRSKLHLHARIAAEAISEYGIAQVKHVLETDRAFTNGSWSSTLETMFIPSGSLAAGGGSIAAPPNTFWAGGDIVDSTGSTTQKPTMHVGKLMDPDNGGLYFIDPTNPDNDNDPLKGKRVFRYNLDILSRATASAPSAGGTVTSYMKQTFSIRAAPLFSNAVYYNMDLELGNGADMILTGSTHSNGRMFIRPAWSAKAQFAGPVTAVKGFWTNYSAGTPLMPYFQIYNNNNGTTPTDNSASTAVVEILPAGSTAFDASKDTIKIAAATTGYSTNLDPNTWVDSTWNKASTTHSWQAHLGEGTVVSIETSTTRDNFLNWSQARFKGNLLTHVNGILPVTLQGIPDYNYVYGSPYPNPKAGKGSGTLQVDENNAAYTYGIATANDPLNAAHSLIEPPLKTDDDSYYEPTERIKYSRNAALYILVNTTANDCYGHKPDGTRVKVKARSYRAFLNDTRATTAVIDEVLLPGQDTYGDNNAQTNPYDGTSGKPNHKQAVPIVTLFNVNYNSGADNGKELTSPRQMWDYRRSDGPYYPGKTADSKSPTYRDTSGAYKYKGKLVNLIDIDMAELKKAVKAINADVGGTVPCNGLYLTGLPPTSNFSTSNYIFRDGATAGESVNVGNTNQIVYAPPTAEPNKAFTKAFVKPATGVQSNWNGAVYIESIAAQLFDKSGIDYAACHRATRNLRNSGVRLVNGRGKAPSIDGVQGFSLITNDAAYILGHFNADGDPNTPKVSGSNVKNTPDVPGGSTGQYPDDATTSDVSGSTELPVSVVADAITLLSQPVYETAKKQISGWNDAMSENTISSDNYSTSWETTTSAGGNQRDGKKVSKAFYKIPFDSDIINGVLDTSSDVKLQPGFTEYSCAMLMGLVPTGKDGIAQHSGGLNNFPRFLEEWSSVYKNGSTTGSGQTARIRGAFVALFECRVATEPWNGRAYGAPTRDWGFNLIFAEGRMPPLTPKVLHFRRIGANDISKAEYNAKLTNWGYTALP